MRVSRHLWVSFSVALVATLVPAAHAADVAAAMGLSEMNVKTRLHRARAALKTLLEPLLKGEAG